MQSRYLSPASYRKALLLWLVVTGTAACTESTRPALKEPTTVESTVVTPQRYNVRILPTLGGVTSEVLHINNRGVAVGFSGKPTSDGDATLWTAEGALKDLGTLGGTTSIA